MNSTQILALDSGWEPRRWISLDDAMFYEYKGLVQAHVGEEIFVYRGGISRMTGEQTQIKTSSIIVINGEMPSSRFRPPALTNEGLFARDRNMCGYCGDVFRNAELTRDHVQPVSKGGQDKWTNVVTACKACNNLKDDIPLGQKLPPGKFSKRGANTMELLYAPYVPCPAEEMILKKSGRIRADQMEYLLSRIRNKETSRVYQEYQLQ